MNIKFNSATMFIKCKSDALSMSNVSNMLARIENDNYNTVDIKIQAVTNKYNQTIEIDKIYEYYQNCQKITPDLFFDGEYSEKRIFITVDLKSNEIVNLQFLLVFYPQFLKENISLFFLLNLEEFDDQYKLTHFLGMNYSVNNNIYFKLKGEPKYERIHKVLNDFRPGEIIPFFYLNFEFYCSCFELFQFQESVYDQIAENPSRLHEIVYEHFYESNRVTKELLKIIYSCVYRKLKNTKKYYHIYNQFEQMPILSAVIFFEILTKINSVEDDEKIIILLEKCLDYTLSLEQLIENAFFYSQGGILSFRVYQKDSEYISDVLKDKSIVERFLLEISIVDSTNGGYILSDFIKNIDGEQREIEEIKNELSSPQNFEFLFQPPVQSAIYNYFSSPKIIIHHYGLQTISLLAKKTTSLLCVKSGNGFYSNDSECFFKQTFDKYPYLAGTQYRMIIPVNYDERLSVYTGISRNQYDCNFKTDNYHVFKFPKEKPPRPKNRNEKTQQIIVVKKLLEEQIEPNKILVIDADSIEDRLQIEYLIKSIFSILSEIGNEEQLLEIAVINLRNKALLKLALRFITLCYNYKNINLQVDKNELFLCDKNCSIELLISGKNYKDIIDNLSQQRVFGTIDDAVFEELEITMQAIQRGDDS